MKKYLWTLAVLLIVVIVGSLYKVYVVDKRTSDEAPVVEDYRNATYRIAGQDVKLVDGISVMQGGMGSSDITTTRIFGNGVVGDFDGDGKQDSAFLMTQNNGGSGIFYIVVAALAVDRGGTHTTQPYLLGDRIAPQSTEYRDGSLIVNYAVRRDGEPFSVLPSVGTSVLLKVQDGKLVKTN